MEEILKSKRRFLSFFLALLMLVTTVFGGGITVKAGAEDGSESVIDYTFDASGRSWGLDFGNSKDAWSRWQSFTMPADGTLKSAEVWLIKRAGEGGETTDLQASIYETAEGVPTEQIGETVTVAGADVTDKGITSIDLSSIGQLTAGKRYALVLTTAELTESFEKTNGKYDWVSNTSTAITEGDVAGKYNAGGFASENVGTMYLKVVYEEGKEQAKGRIDYTFDASQKSWGYDFGSSKDAFSRWQSFTMPEDGTLDSVEVWLIKRTDPEGNTADLVASVYSMTNGLPDQSLGSVTIPGAEVTDRGVTTIDLSSVGGLTKDTQYAVVLTTDPLADNLERTNGRYDWVSNKTTEAAAGEAAGQIGLRGTNDETNAVGIMYLAVNYTPGAADPNPTPSVTEMPPAPEDAVPCEISLEVSSQETLAIGGTTEVTAKVYDQEGAEIPNAEISVSADSDAVTVQTEGNKTTVTGAKEGVASVRVQSGSAVASTDVYVYDPGKSYTVPQPGMVINSSTALKPGVYHFDGADTGITIGADNVEVTADYVKIVNTSEESRPDTTTGAYAYRLNPVSGKTAYHMARKLVLSNASSISISFDAKARHFSGSLKLQVSEDGASWTDLKSVTPLGDWEKTSVDLSAYKGKTITVRLCYETDTQIPEDMELLIDTVELFEDGVRTFSDLCEAKPFYYWDMSYEDGKKVADSMRGKPFDRTECTINTSAFKGTGIVMKGVSGSSISGITVSGFYWAMNLTDCSGITVTNCDLSDNYTDPAGGWGDQEGGALLMNGVSSSTIQGNNANNNANALIMRQSDRNTIKNNSFAIASDVCLEMDNSSYNTIENNDFSWGIRIDAYDEVHARDSTSSLFESGSNYNDINYNDFTHGGDGIFLRPLDGFACEGNVFRGNDASYANNNAVESWAGRNYYIDNKANWSSYGFWMGGSDESEMIGNEAAYNGICPHNAPESFGNAGISIVQSNPSSHMKIVSNYIHDNYGPGIALTHTQSWPAYHYLIQNNRIEKNVTSAYNSGHVGYAIWMDQIEWVDISGNQIQGNAKDEIHTTANSKLVTVREGAYLGDEAAYRQQVPVAAISADKDVYYVGEEITFSGAGSTDPNGDPLTFRWDMGDGTFAVGETVKHTFTETGYYDVAFTVTDGTWSDLIWLNVNVVSPGEEIGTEEDASAWEVTSNNGATVLTTQMAADGKQREEIPYYTYYTVDGTSSIKMHSSAGNNTLTYPASKDAALDLSGDNALSFSMKVQNGAYEGANHRSPIVRLYTDANNYVQYQATTTLLSPYYYKEIFAQMQLRQEWVAVTIPYDGSSMWEKSVVGTPDMSKINYISINTENNANNFTFYIDALKSVSVEESKANAYVRSIANDGTAIYSSKADDCDVEAPHDDTLNTSARWESAQGDEDIWYGVDLGTERYMDRVDYYLFYEPIGNPSLDTLVLPNSAVVEYEEDGEWKSVTNAEAGTITPNRNTVTFDRVKAQKVRVRFDTTDHAPVALYGFHVFHTENYMTELDYENHPVPTVTSTVASDIVLDSVEIWGTVNDKSLWESDIHDLQVYIYNTDASGKGPEGAYLAKGVIKKDSVNPSDLPKLFKVELRDDDGNQVSLKAGTRYVLLLAMERDYSNTGQAHWRFVTSKNVAAAAEETFGKVTGQNNDYRTINGYSIEALGTGWMKLYAADSETPVVDYSFETTGNGGYGVGAYTEDSRYQTFTIPEATTDSVNNGLVNDQWNWTYDGESGSIFVELDEAKEIGLINIAFEENGVPEKLVILNGEDEVVTLTADELKAGFNEILLEKSISAKNLTFIFTSGENPVLVSEIELMKTETAAENQAVKEVEELIDAIGEVTLDSREAIEAARAAYEALSEEEQALVSNLDVLEAAEAKLAELEKAEQEKKDAAKHVEELIDAIGEVTLDSREAIEAARAAYEALSEEEKALVSNLDVLEAAEAKLAALEKASQEEKEAAERVEELIDAIGEVTFDSREAIEAARAAYEALSETAKNLVSNLDVLEAAEAKLAALEKASQEEKDAAKRVEELIDAIGEVTLDSREAIEAARAAYEALSETAKDLVSNLDVLEAAEKRLAELEEEEKKPKPDDGDDKPGDNTGNQPGGSTGNQPGNNTPNQPGANNAGNKPGTGKQPGTTSVRTGDPTSIAGLLAAMAASLGGIGLGLKKKRREKR